MSSSSNRHYLDGKQRRGQLLLAPFFYGIWYYPLQRPLGRDPDRSGITCWGWLGFFDRDDHPVIGQPIDHHCGHSFYVPTQFRKGIGRRSCRRARRTPTAAAVWPRPRTTTRPKASLMSLSRAKSSAQTVLESPSKPSYDVIQELFESLERY